MCERTQSSQVLDNKAFKAALEREQRPVERAQTLKPK